MLEWKGVKCPLLSVIYFVWNVILRGIFFPPHITRNIWEHSQRKTCFHHDNIKCLPTGHVFILYISGWTFLDYTRTIIGLFCFCFFFSGKYLIRADWKKYQINSGSRELREAVDQSLDNITHFNSRSKQMKRMQIAPVHSTGNKWRQTFARAAGLSTDGRRHRIWCRSLPAVHLCPAASGAREALCRETDRAPPLPALYAIISSARRRVHVVAARANRERERASSTPKFPQALPQQAVRYLLLFMDELYATLRAYTVFFKKKQNKKQSTCSVQPLNP